MPFLTRFKVDDLKVDVPVLQLHYQLDRDVDHSGDVSSIIKGGTISLTVKSNRKTSIFEWMTKHEVHDGAVIHMDPKDPKKELKKLEFKGAAVIKYAESSHITGTDCVSEIITLSAKSIKIGGGEHVNE